MSTVVKKAFLIFASGFLFMSFNSYVYSEDMKGKRVAPIYYNPSTRETIQFLDGVKITQTPDAQFSKAQLDQIVSVLDETSPKILSNISNIKAVNNVAWGGEATLNTQNNTVIISLNTDTSNRKRSFTELVNSEIGHAAFTVLPIADKTSFIQLHNYSQDPSDYATSDYQAVKTSYAEDFADTYMKYNTTAQNIPPISPILNEKMAIIDKNFGQNK
jgi:hypothetical protein